MNFRKWLAWCFENDLNTRIMPIKWPQCLWMQETIKMLLFNPEPSHAQLCRLLLNPFFSLRIPCYIHFQEEPPRAGIQTAKCKSHNQSPYQSVLDCCKPQGASIPIWSLPQDVRKRAQVNLTTSPIFLLPRFLLNARSSHHVSFPVSWARMHNPLGDWVLQASHPRVCVCLSMCVYVLCSSVFKMLLYVVCLYSLLQSTA